NAEKEVGVVGAKLCLGSGKNGAQFGPDAMRRMGVIERIGQLARVEDFGDILQSDAERDPQSEERLKHLEQIAEFNGKLSDEVHEILEQEKFSLVLGGDHSLAIGSIAGTIRKFGDNLGLIWIDAHADINTDETSPTGNIHGMPIASLLGLGSKALTDIAKNQRISADKVMIIAARDIDSGEEMIISENNVSLLKMSQISQEGIESICKQVNEIISGWGVDNIHLSIDIDSLDSKLVPGTGTPVADGLTVDELNKLIDTIMATRKVKCADVVELNPMLDSTDGTTQKTIDIVEYLVSKIN
ncbi:MAG: arginase, partial [Rikenellaceae bacterium]|nr:arginase [Rikenellaceae bacterium]